MKTKEKVGHTPGPWTASDEGRIYGEGGAREIGLMSANQESDAICDADIALTIAAPELLEAAKGLFLYRGAGKFATEKAEDRLRAAIQKAQGDK